MLPSDEAPLGGPASFGHPGRGGSLGFGDPESGVAFGYVVSHIRQDMDDNRAGLLVQAVAGASARDPAAALSSVTMAASLPAPLICAHRTPGTTSVLALEN